MGVWGSLLGWLGALVALPTNGETAASPRLGNLKDLDKFESTASATSTDTGAASENGATTSHAHKPEVKAEREQQQAGTQERRQQPEEAESGTKDSERGGTAGPFEAEVSRGGGVKDRRSSR